MKPGPLFDVRAWLDLHIVLEIETIDLLKLVSIFGSQCPCRADGIMGVFDSYLTENQSVAIVLTSIGAIIFVGML